MKKALKFLNDSPESILNVEIRKSAAGLQATSGTDNENSNSVLFTSFEITGENSFRGVTPDGSVSGAYHYLPGKLYLNIDGETFLFEEISADMDQNGGAGQYRSPMPGKIISINIKPEDEVVENQTLIVMEAMKMENAIKAHTAGKVTALNVSVGDTVRADEILVEVE